MGAGIANNFLKNGYEVWVWNRSEDRLSPMLEKGAHRAATPREATENAEMIFEVTANDQSSKSVWMGRNGILAGATPEKTLITCATLSADWTDKLARMCEVKKLSFSDMPMTGGRKGAEEGKLILLVGGDREKLKEIENDLKAIAVQIHYFGKAGNGMRYKLILNTLQAIHITAFGEALKLAGEIGLDVKLVGDGLAERPGGTTTNIAWRDYQTEPDPINFSVEWITKDLKYTRRLNRKIKLPLLDKTLQTYRKAVQEKMGKKDWTVVNKMK